MKAKLTAMVALAVAIAACSSSSPTASNAPNPAALSSGASVKTLAAGKLDGLPTGPVYNRVIRFTQEAGYVIQSKQHVASIVFVETGAHRLTLEGQPQSIDLMAGQATFHQSVAHTHLNPGPGLSVWYSIAVWPSSARTQPLVDKTAFAAFESSDVAPEVLPRGAYSEVLRQVTLATRGTSGAHRFGGMIAFFVLSGSVTIKSAHQPAVTLDVGKGVAFLPDAPLQETNAGTGQAVYLEFITTPVGKDFEVPLQQPPAA